MPLARLAYQLAEDGLAVDPARRGREVDHIRVVVWGAQPESVALVAASRAVMRDVLLPGEERVRRVGADTSLDEIARRAGVASGTLYRHFPTRPDLPRTLGRRDELGAPPRQCPGMRVAHAVLRVGAALLTRAGRAGTVVPEAEPADVLEMIGAIARAAQDSPGDHAQANRLLTLLTNGLRTRPQPVNPPLL